MAMMADVGDDGNYPSKKKLPPEDPNFVSQADLNRKAYLARPLTLEEREAAAAQKALGGEWVDESGRANPVYGPDRNALNKEVARRKSLGIDVATEEKTAERQRWAAAKMSEWEKAVAPRMLQADVEAALKASAMGQGESAAQLQLKEAYAQAMSDQLSMAASATGSPRAQFAAQQQAQWNLGQQQSAMARQGATLRAEEMERARAQLIGAASAQSQIDANQRALAAQMSSYYYGAQFAPEDKLMDRQMRAYELAQAVDQARIQRDFQREQAEEARPWQLLGAGLQAGGAVTSSLLSGPAFAARAAGGAAGAAGQALAPMATPPPMQLSMPQVGQGYGYRRSW